MLDIYKFKNYVVIMIIQIELNLFMIENKMENLKFKFMMIEM